MYGPDMDDMFSSPVSGSVTPSIICCSAALCPSLHSDDHDREYPAGMSVRGSYAISTVATGSSYSRST